MRGLRGRLPRFVCGVEKLGQLLHFSAVLLCGIGLVTRAGTMAIEYLLFDLANGSEIGLIIRQERP